MEKFDLENFPTSESAKKMLSYVTNGFYDKSYVGKWIYQVMGLEYDEALKIAEELPAQMFPETATWGLMYHEIKWGLPVRQNLSYEERRRLIYQKRDYRAPITPYRMERYLEDTTGFEVHIADVSDPGEYGFAAPHPNVFKAYFIGDGTLDSKKAIALLDKLKQSHTTYSITDIVIITLDNSDIEKFITINVKMGWSFPFWNCNLFDGSWNFDGSILLDAQRRYNLILGLKYNEGEFAENEGTECNSLTLRCQLNNSVITDNSRAIIGFGINFWNILYFDGSWKFDGKKILNACRNSMTTKMKLQTQVRTGEEAIGYVAVTTRRNLWYFDGSVKMDGSRLFNSIYRKEDL